MEHTIHDLRFHLTPAGQLQAEKSLQQQGRGQGLRQGCQEALRPAAAHLSVRLLRAVAPELCAAEGGGGPVSSPGG